MDRRPSKAKKLPDCMMPDGGSPCLGYLDLQAEIESLRRVSSAAHEHAERLIKSNSVLARIGGMALKHVLDHAALKEES